MEMHWRQLTQAILKEQWNLPAVRSAVRTLVDDSRKDATAGRFLFGRSLPAKASDEFTDGLFDSAFAGFEVYCKARGELLEMLGHDPKQYARDKFQEKLPFILGLMVDRNIDQPFAYLKKALSNCANDDLNAGLALPKGAQDEEKKYVRLVPLSDAHLRALEQEEAEYEVEVGDAVYLRRKQVLLGRQIIFEDLCLPYIAAHPKTAASYSAFLEANGAIELIRQYHGGHNEVPEAAWQGIVKQLRSGENFKRSDSLIKNSIRQMLAPLGRHLANAIAFGVFPAWTASVNRESAFTGRLRDLLLPTLGRGGPPADAEGPLSIEDLVVPTLQSVLAGEEPWDATPGDREEAAFVQRAEEMTGEFFGFAKSRIESDPRLAEKLCVVPRTDDDLNPATVVLLEELLARLDALEG